MKTIGKQTLFLETGKENPRNGGDYTLNCLKISKVYFDEIAK